MSEAASFPPLILLDATAVATSIRRNLLLEGDEADMPRALLLTTRLGGVGAAVRGGLRGPADDGSRTGATTLTGECPQPPCTFLRLPVPAAASQRARRPGRTDALIGEHGLNVDGQVLSTRGELGYVVTDVNGEPPSSLLAMLSGLHETVRLQTFP